MRHTIKGAAAFAALCAGALALSPMAYAAGTGPSVPGEISATRAEFGGGADHTTSSTAAWVGRISGHDRMQTSLESLASTKSVHDSVANIFVVEKNSTVDALTLAPLAKRLLLNKADAGLPFGNSAVVYANKDGLTKGAVDSLKKYVDNAKAVYYMVGGTAKLSTAVDQQVGSSIYSELGDETSVVNAAATYRLDGKDRYETAYLVSGLVIGGGNVWQAGAAYGKAIVLKADYERALREWNEADAMGAKLQKDVEAAQEALNNAYDELIAATPTPVKGSDLEKATAAVVKTQGDLAEKLKAFNDCTAAKNCKTADPTEQYEYTLALTKYNEAVKAFGDLVNKDAKSKAAAAQIEKLQDKVNDLTKALKEVKDKDNKNLKENLDVATKNLAAAVANGFNGKSDCGVPAGNDEKGKATTACVGAGKTLIAKQRAEFVKTVDAAWRAYSGDVVFATGTNFADALTAGPAAAKLPAPILLTAGSSYMETVRALGKGIANKSIYAVGGPAAKAAKDLVATKKYHATIALDGKGLYVGKDRYETAYKLAKAFYLGKETTANGAKADHENYNRDMVLASGVVGADAVVAGVWCVNNIYAGILLTRPDSLPTVTADYIAFGDNVSAQQGAVKNLVIFGGYAAVSHETASVAWAKMGQ